MTLKNCFLSFFAALIGMIPVHIQANEKVVPAESMEKMSMDNQRSKGSEELSILRPVEEINDDNFSKKISEGYAIVDFYADWCGPCKRLAPIFDKIAHDMSSIHFYKVNVDKAQKTAQEFSVRSIPTIIIFSKGKKVAERTGSCDESTLKQFIKNNTK